MQSPKPQLDPDDGSGNMRSIVDRMFRAKWITESLVKPDEFWFNLTELGLQQIGKMSDAFIRVAPGFFKAENTSILTADSIKQPSSAELFSMMLEIGPIMAELQPPPFSSGERDAMFGLLASSAREKGKGQIPRSRR
jgi:hypothetical protein